MNLVLVRFVFGKMARTDQALAMSCLTSKFPITIHILKQLTFYSDSKKDKFKHHNEEELTQAIP